MKVPLKDKTLSRLQLEALRAFPSSPTQKEIQKEIHKRLENGEKTWLPPGRKKSKYCSKSLKTSIERK